LFFGFGFFFFFVILGSELRALPYQALHQPFKNVKTARHQWLIPVILATQEAEMGRIPDGSQPGHVVHEILSRKNPSQKRTGEGLNV
jgi:hypothetical protein